MIREEEHYTNLKKCLFDMIADRQIDSYMHICNVKRYTEILAQEYAILYPDAGMTRDRIATIAEASIFHDIGKLWMQDGLLTQPGRLSKEEYEVLKGHTYKGAEVIELMFGFRGREFVELAQNICLYHHELYGGNGYPFGYHGEEIPI